MLLTRNPRDFHDKANLRKKIHHKEELRTQDPKILQVTPVPVLLQQRGLASYGLQFKSNL